MRKEVRMDARRDSLFCSTPESFFFEEYFKKNGTHVVKAKISPKSQTVDSSNMMNCAPLLKKEDEFRLFRKYNYYRYRIVSTIAGKDWKDAMGDRDEMRRRILRLDDKVLGVAENFVALSDETRNVILKSNMRLMVKPISRYEWADSNRRDELISNSCIHIIKAINGFDYRRGFKFSTYCINAIKNNLYRDFSMDVRRRSRCWGEMGEQEIVSIDVRNTEPYDLKFVNEALASLDETHRKVVGEIFGVNSEKKDMRKIAQEMNISPYLVSRIRDRALEAMSKIKYDPVA